MHLIARLEPCKSGDWPFPGDMHIKNPQTGTCVRCGNVLPPSFVGMKITVPEHLKKKPKDIKEEVGL